VGGGVGEDLGALGEAVGAEDSRGRDHRVLDAADREPVSALLGLDGGGGGEVVLAHVVQATRALLVDRGRKPRRSSIRCPLARRGVPILRDAAF